MTDKEIEKYKRNLDEIHKGSDTATEEKWRACVDLARKVQANVHVPDLSLAVRVNMLTHNINDALQTETMINACRSAKWSCRWAAIAATLSFFGILVAWSAIVVMILIAVFVK